MSIKFTVIWAIVIILSSACIIKECYAERKIAYEEVTEYDGRGNVSKKVNRIGRNNLDRESSRGIINEPNTTTLPLFFLILILIISSLIYANRKAILRQIKLEFNSNDDNPKKQEYNTRNFCPKHPNFNTYPHKEDLEDAFKEAAIVIIENKQASILFLQRSLGIGYTLAARIIDRMDDLGIVGPYEGSMSRKVLIDMETWLKGNYSLHDNKREEEPIKRQYNNHNAHAHKDSDTRTCYDILGISKGASIEEIKKAYQKKMLEYHPDRTGGLGDKLKDMATEESKKINHAYDEIMKERGGNK